MELEGGLLLSGEREKKSRNRDVAHWGKTPSRKRSTRREGTGRNRVSRESVVDENEKNGGLIQLPIFGPRHGGCKKLEKELTGKGQDWRRKIVSCTVSYKEKDLGDASEDTSGVAGRGIRGEEFRILIKTLGPDGNITGQDQEGRM